MPGYGPGGLQRDKKLHGEVQRQSVAPGCFLGGLTTPWCLQFYNIYWERRGKGEGVTRRNDEAVFVIRERNLPNCPWLFFFSFKFFTFFCFSNSYSAIHGFKKWNINSRKEQGNGMTNIMNWARWGCENIFYGS